MSIHRRLIALSAFAGLLALAAVLLVHSPRATAGSHMSYTHLNKIQRRILSSTLASALGPAPNANRMPPNDNGGGPDGLPFAPPASFKAVPLAPVTNYVPGSTGKCSATLGIDMKVNQNCLNISDPNLQGRGQANNETSIAANPMAPEHLVASDNNYIRGDGTCGAHFSLDNGRTWSDTTTPNSFTYGFAGNARQYWQASGDTSVAWDTRGNSYLSCQVFNRGTAASANPDQSSGFIVFRSTQNNGASFNFPGRYVTSFFDPTGTAGVLEDKQLMTVDDNVSSPFRDRIYVTWTEFAANGTAYIWESHSSDYGETFSPRRLVSRDGNFCTNTFGVATNEGRCNENQFSDPFVGPDGTLYVVWSNFNNQPTSGTSNHYQVLLARSTDGGSTFSAPVRVSSYNDLPDCDTYQGLGSDPGRSCVPEKGSSTKSVFRATNYASGAVDPQNPNVVAVTFGSYINPDSKPSNGCVPAGFAADGNPLYTGVKTAGACNNKILISVSTNGGRSFPTLDPARATMVNQAAGQARTDQFWQWAAFTKQGSLAVDYYDRQYGRDEFSGASDFSLSGSSNLSSFATTRVTSSSMPAPTQFYGVTGGQFYGDYIGLAAGSNGLVHPIWSDTRSRDLFLCPGTATGPGNPPALCGGIEPNGQEANDEETFTATVRVPTGS